MIVGICGLIGSGKDTVAEYLVEHHGFQHESFAGPLKDAVAAVFGWPRALLEGDTAESRHWREQTDPWWSERLGRTITPRWVLQQWGTDVLRAHFHDAIWIASCERRIADRSSPVVISDLRFPNEFAALRKAGARIVRVRRGADPEWFSAAATLQTTPHISPHARTAHITLQQAGVHTSEVAWAAEPPDHVIENNGTLEELYAAVRVIIGSYAT